MTGLFIWGLAAVVYAVFRAWYDNWSGPLRTDEIERFVAKVENSELGLDPNAAANFRVFMENDDGREFFMVNLVALHRSSLVIDGETEPQRPAAVLQRYTGYFMPALFRRAGHPAFFARAAGGYVESWGVEDNPGWTFAGMVRYRSRRDAAILATDPRFDSAHVFKRAAMASTFAFPAAPGNVFFGPRVWVGLVVALAAALAHLVMLV